MSKTDSNPVDAILSLLAGRDDAQAILAEVTARLAPTVALPADDRAFAARVLAAARASKTGRFGRDKVFISHVAQQLVREGVAIGDVDAFKARLVAVHRADLLTLHRADLVEAMSASDVDESETRYRTATFHFVNIGR